MKIIFDIPGKENLIYICRIIPLINQTTLEKESQSASKLAPLWKNQWDEEESDIQFMTRTSGQSQHSVF